MRSQKGAFQAWIGMEETTLRAPMPQRIPTYSGRVPDHRIALLRYQEDGCLPFSGRRF
jgi:hypothetical protein